LLVTAGPRDARSRWRKRAAMRNTGITEATDRDVSHDENAPAGQFTSTAFFWEAGTLIAICLALGVLMQLLLG
ncbi:MAG TPA: hypothetical protein VHX39_02880, partial [Acetobacteraceae bacterium]|nr:hypothetical protein [Acetobacteraceae bacterium]